MNTKKMRVVLYCRVAHVDQWALENQKNALYGYALEQGYDVQQIVMEQAGGLDIDRPGLRKLLDIVSAGCMDAVLVDSASRISRSPSYYYSFMDSLKSYNVKLFSRMNDTDDIEMLMRTLVKRAKKAAHASRR